MGNHEIYTCIAPALGKGDGPAIWHLLPQYPTLQNVVGLLFDSPEYFQMFWNSIFYTGAILAGQMLFGMPAAWGLARYSFRVRKTVYRLFILVMMMPFQVTMLSQYLVLNRLGMLDRPQSVVLPGLPSGMPIRKKIWNSPAPSIRAASMTFSGIPRKKRYIIKTENVAKIPGKTTDCGLSSIPRRFNTRYCDNIVT